MGFQDKEKVFTFPDYIKYILEIYGKKSEDLLRIGYEMRLAEKMQEIDNQLKSGQLSTEEADYLYEDAKKTYDFALQAITIDNGKGINTDTDTEIGTDQELG